MNGNTITRTSTLIVCIALAQGAVVCPAQEGKKLGWLSKKYEVGQRGPETISTGKLASGADDPGGISYGSYQMASKRGLDGATVQAFVESYYENDFSHFDPKKRKREWFAPGSDEFNERWRQVVDRDGDRFLNNEHEFIYETHYKPVADDVRQKTGLDVDARGEALQNVFWSTAVQHGSPLDVKKGHGHTLIRRALGAWTKEQLSAEPGTPGAVSDKDFIDAIYDERSRMNPRDEQRYTRERGDAVRAQGREPQPDRASDFNKTALGQLSRNLGFLAAPDRSPPKELFVERGQMTFDFSGFETPYSSSRKPAVPGAYSGVRIGRGYDLGKLDRRQAERDLRAAGLADPQVDTYAAAAGLVGEDAQKYLDSLAYGPLSDRGRKSGLTGADLRQFISDHSANSITLAQQKTLFETSYARAEAKAREAFPAYDQFPAPAREAIADLIFDRGIDELKSTHPGLLDHIDKQDWSIAAALSKRKGAGVERNLKVRRLLEESAKAAADRER